MNGKATMNDRGGMVGQRGLGMTDLNKNFNVESYVSGDGVVFLKIVHGDEVVGGMEAGNPYE
jgi:hypothetical protein